MGGGGGGGVCPPTRTDLCSLNARWGSCPQARAHPVATAEALRETACDLLQYEKLVALRREDWPGGCASP